MLAATMAAANVTAARGVVSSETLAPSKALSAAEGFPSSESFSSAKTFFATETLGRVRTTKPMMPAGPFLFGSEAGVSARKVLVPEIPGRLFCETVLSRAERTRFITSIKSTGPAREAGAVVSLMVRGSSIIGARE